MMRRKIIGEREGNGGKRKIRKKLRTENEAKKHRRRRRE
jgi:hypothetical protein